MTRTGEGILLTGATGLLGRYLLRDLLLAGYPVTVLAREAAGVRAAERIGELLDFWSESLGRRLPEPAVVCGDLRAENLGLTASGRSRLALHCHRVIHAAASLAFRPSPDGEPWATNVAGTRHLLACCRNLGIFEFHHVSTAFVCGETAEPIHEDDGERKRRFRNVYEQSKAEAETQVRAAAGIQATIYRPSIIVGDSCTGYTSNYHGLYRFLSLAARLAEAPSGSMRRLELRLPLTGDEPRNLVPVDWVSQAIVQLLGRPTWHGRVFHLTAPQPVAAKLIKEVGEEVLKIDGVRFGGPEAFATQTPLEQFFLDRVQEYWPYLHGDPVFDRRNVEAALPDLPAVVIDRSLLTRLMQFAAADRWGQGQRRPARPGRRRQLDCRHYVEQVFPAAARRSPLGRAAELNVVVALDVRGEGGGQWTLGWVDGNLEFIRCGLESADVLYRTDPATFEDVVGRQRSPQTAFGDRLIEIEGNVETALKLAVLFDTFLADEVPVGEAASDALLDSV